LFGEVFSDAFLSSSLRFAFESRKSAGEAEVVDDVRHGFSAPIARFVWEEVFGG
jgi:hypothetical protein